MPRGDMSANGSVQRGKAGRMTEYNHWCGNCQIKIYFLRHYGKELSWKDCPYSCEYGYAMRNSTKTMNDIDPASTVDIDWTKHETTTGVSKSITVNPAYPLGGSGNYQCSDTVDFVPVDELPVDELKNRDVKFYDKGKEFAVALPIGLDLDTVNKVEIRGREFVPVKVIEQFKWERDTAIEQLEEHGIPFCGKADVVAVVRCKECKHRPKYDGPNRVVFPDEVCPYQCDDLYYNWMPSDDWFCADGERKMNGDC